MSNVPPTVPTDYVRDNAVWIISAAFVPFVADQTIWSFITLIPPAKSSTLTIG